MIKNIFSLLFVVLIFFSCRKDNKGENVISNTITYEIEISESKFFGNSLSNCIKDFTFLELKTNNVNYIAEISKVENFKNNFYVLDAKKSNLYVFDITGNMIRKIGQRGNGPGEYKNISDFAINTEKETISILSSKNIKVLEYNLQGEFLKDLSLPSIFPKKMNLINNKYYALYTDNSNDSFKDLVYLDLSGKIVKEDFTYPDDIFQMSFDFTGGVSKIGNRFLYSRSSSPKIYEIDNNLNYKYIYDFGLGAKAWLEKDKFELEKFNMELNKLEMSFLGNNFFINNNVLFFDYTDGKKRKRGFYNISFDNLYTTDSFVNDGIGQIFNNYVGIDDDSRNIVAYTPEYYKETCIYFKGLNEELEKLDNQLFNKFKDSHESSNQYLLFFNLSIE